MYKDVYKNIIQKQFWTINSRHQNIYKNLYIKILEFIF